MPIFVSVAAVKLRQLVEASSLTAVARELNLTTQQLSHYTAGRKRPSLPNMVRIEDEKGIACKRWLEKAKQKTDVT
jgi:hypothetical protein